MTSSKELKQTLPTHSRSSSVSSNGTLTPTSITQLTIPKKLLTKSYFFPSIIIFILILLYSTNNLYDSPAGARRLSGSFNRSTLTLQGSKVILGDETSLWEKVGVEIELSHSLESRLKDWENSPLDGLEPSDWVANSMKVSNQNRSSSRNSTRTSKAKRLFIFLEDMSSQ